MKNSFHVFIFRGENKKTNRNRQAIARHAKVKNTRHKIKKFYFFFLLLWVQFPEVEEYANLQIGRIRK
jgi:hypothetical protein